MSLLAVPLDPLHVTDKTATLLLDGMLSVPAIFPVPGTPEERRILIAAILSDPLNHAWLVWNGGTLVGALLLTQVVPKIDAQCHFVFFDRTLYGRRDLLWNLMGRIFHELDLQRLTVEIPEYLTPLYKFVRKKLGFRFDGEGAPLGQQVAEAVKRYVDHPETWLAKIGSRRERGCWNPETGEWTDLLRLRILRTEYLAAAPPREPERHAQRSTESPRSPGHPRSPATAARISSAP